MNIDPRLKKIVENKTIAYICPGQHLKGMGLGEKIDSYDLTIRVNQYFEIQKEKHKDYGSRMDLMFSAFNACNISECKENWGFFINNKDLKAVVVSMVSDRITIDFQKDFEQKINIPFIIPDPKEIHNEIVLDAGTMCNSGLIGLYILLLCNVKKIFIAGMNFYNMGNYGYVYFEKHYDSITKGKGIRQQFVPNKYKIVTPKNSRWDLHNLHRQILYFKKIIKNNKDKFELDFYLKENIWKYDNKLICMIIDDNTNNEDLNKIINITKSLLLFDDIYINTTNDTLEKMAEYNVKFYKRSLNLKKDKIIYDFIKNKKISHIIVIYPNDLIVKLQELKIFTNFFMAYNLDCLFSVNKDELDENYNVININNSSSNSKILGFNINRYKKYIENKNFVIKRHHFILSNLDNKNVPIIDSTKDIEKDFINNILMGKK
jgi:hypothetical protein